MCRSILFACVATFSASALLSTGFAADEYAKPPAFLPLPLGAVKPTGWLLDWCETAANGITGHADQLTPIIAKGWIGDAKVDVKKDSMQVGDKPKGYMLEQAAYWLDGAVRLGHLLDDEALLKKCRLRFDVVLRRVEAGLPPMNVNQDMWKNGEKWALWPMAVLGRALVAEYSATDDPRYLHALEKIYAGYSKLNLNDTTFSLIDHNGRQPMSVETMFEAYRLGGDKNLRDEAITVLREEDPEIKERLAWHEHDIATGTTDPHFYTVKFGHAVSFNESTKIPAIGYLYTGDPAWLRFSEASFDDMKENEMLPYGLTSGHEQPGGIGPFALTELCNAIDYSWSNIWLLRITGKGTYGDAVERTLFNAGAAAIAPDFKSHVYYLSPNRIDAAHPDHAPGNIGGTAHFAPMQQPLCCTANLSRLLPNYVMHLWMASEDGGLAATLYGPCLVKTKVGDTPVSLETRTEYPFGDQIGIMVSATKPTAFPLHLRVPEWSTKTVVTVNNQPQAVVVKDGFAQLSRTWTARDIVVITFSHEPKIVTGVCKDGAPYASVFYGPLLFALPIPTVGNDLNAPRPGVASQFALAPNAPVEVIRNRMPARWSWNTNPPPLQLKTSAVPFPPNADFALPPAAVAPGSARPQTITLVPFGATAFRVSMFGVVASPTQASR